MAYRAGDKPAKPRKPKKPKQPKGNSGPGMARGTLRGPIYVPAHTRRAPSKKPPVDPILGQLNAIFGPQQQFLQSQIAQEQASAQAQAARQRALADAQGKWYGSHVPQQIQGIYGTAADQQSHFAMGFSHGMQLAQQQGADSANQQIGLAGGPAGQMLHPSADAADVLYGVGGYIPATTLNQQGAAFSSAAALQGGAIAAQGGKDAAKTLADAQTSIVKLETELSSLLQKKAETGLKLSESRRAEKLKIALANQKAKLTAAKDAEEFRYKWATLDLRQKTAILSDKRQAQRIFQAEKRLGLTAQNQSYNQWYKKQSLAIQNARLQQGDVRLQQSQARLNKTKTKPKYTPIQIARFKQDAADTAHDAWFGIQDAKAADGWGLKPLTYGQAYADMVQHGIPPWIAQNALNRYWKRRGYTVSQEDRMAGKYNTWQKAQSGRPLKDFYNPKAAAARGGRQNASYDPSVPPQVQNAISAAEQQLGQKYVWGAESRAEGGFDCSGLIDWAFRQAGVDFPGRLTTWSAAKMGSPVPLNALRPGDFIISNGGKHMTLYIGGGRVIAASSARGRVVIMSVGDLGPIVGARRINFGGSA